MWKHNVRAGIALGLLLSWPVGAAQAGAVAGKVEVGTVAMAEAVVSIETVPGHLASPGHMAIIDQRNKTFVPHVTAVEKGAVVAFVNNDDFLHNTYSVSRTQPFNLHQPTRGSRSLLKVDKPGVIEVRCHIHANMQAWIVVLANPFFAVTSQSGLFQIRGVPPGTYEMKVWSERYGTLEKRVTVPEHGNGIVIFKYAGR